MQEGKAFENYYVIALSSNKLPDDFRDYKDVFSNTFDSNTSAGGKLYNYKKPEDLEETLKAGRYFVEQYMRKNLADGEAVNPSDNNVYGASATNAWSLFANDADKKVSGTIRLMYKIADGENDVYGPLYYVSNLKKRFAIFLCPAGLTLWTRPSVPLCF